MILKLFWVWITTFSCLFAPGSLEDAPEPNPNEILSLGSTRFVLFRKEIGWIEARDVCKNRTGRLAVLPQREDAERLIAEIKAISTPYSEQDMLNNMRHEYGMDRRYWIGLSDLTKEGSWEWVQDGGNNNVKLNYDLWYPHQPDIPGEHCVTLWNPAYQLGDTHTFNDESCGNKYYFICEETDTHSTPDPQPEGDSSKIAGRSLGKHKKPKKKPTKKTSAKVESTTVKSVSKTRKAKKPKKFNKSSGENPSPIPISSTKNYFQKKKSRPISPPTDPDPIIPTPEPAKKRHTKLFVAQKRAAEAEPGDSQLNKEIAMDYENDLIEMTKDYEKEKEKTSGDPTEEEEIEMKDLLKEIKQLSPSEKKEFLEYLKDKQTPTTESTLILRTPKPGEKSTIASIGLQELLHQRRKLKNKF